jgi:membrane protein implicated in regulation of membrane protease activity
MEMFGMNAILFWFLLGVVFLFLEAMTPGVFLVFFGLGAWATGAVVLVAPLGPSAQWLIFMVVSVVALILLRRKLQTLFQGRLARTDNLDDPVFTERYLGQRVLVLEETGPGQPGLAELGGTNWGARTEGPAIPAGARARVVRLDGLTLIIEAEGPEDKN